jgi:hypothetical protein
MAKTKVHGEFLKDSVVRFTAKAGENITKGQAVYISGISGEVPVVSLADADDTAKMPAFGLAESTVSTNADVEITSFGTLKGLDTSSYSLGDILYVDTTAGSLTNNPSGLEATKLQNIGIVQRVHATSGSIKVGGAGRTNAVPNLDDGDIFIGDSNNKAVSDSFTNVLNTEAGINSSADATAITIDSSQNVMVGTTDTFPGGGDTNTGVSLSSTGAVTASRDGDFAARFNRKTSDGEIIGLNKDGSPVGSIGTQGSSTYIAGASSGLRFAATNIMPVNSSGTFTDNTSDLGGSTERFKDLYLSGTAYIDTSVGIGLTDPDQALEIGAGGKLKLSRADNARSLLLFNDNDYGTIETSNDPIKIASQSYTRFDVSGTEQMRIDSDGSIHVTGSSPSGIYLDNNNVRIYHGTNRLLEGSTDSTAVVSLAEGFTGYLYCEPTIRAKRGISFGTDTATANQLDDYEEGTWTPSVAGITPVTITGTYTKVGNLCYVGGFINFPSNSDTTNIAISNFPFTCKDDNDSRAGLVISYSTRSVFTSILMDNNTTIAKLRNLGGAVPTNADFSGKVIHFGGVYQTA